MLHPRVGVEVAVVALALAEGDVYVDRKGLHSAAIIARANRRQLCPNRSPARVSRESRGGQPLWQEVWRMAIFTFPLPSRKGAGAWSKHPLKQKPPCRVRPPWFSLLPPNGACREAEPLCQGFQGVSPSTCKQGVQRGQPLWQEVWRMCLHKLLFLTSPFLPGKGPGAWSKHPLKPKPPCRERPPWYSLLPPNGACREAEPLCQGFQGVSPSTCKQGVQRGATSLARGMEDVPP